MLQIVDGSLPRVSGVVPLLLAVEDSQDMLVRAYLSFDAAEQLSPQEQAACLSSAIERRILAILVQLLGHIRPSHEHLLQAIRLGFAKAADALLTAGGPGLLHPRHRSERSGSPGRARPRPQEHEQPNRPQMTPLALACFLGDVAMVEALFTWSRRERAHLDPTAPLLPGQTQREDGSGTSSASVWHDRGESAIFGDPPMVMIVRGRASLEEKLMLLNLLTLHGFPADSRSPIDSWTALLAAVDLGSMELVLELIKLGGRLSCDKHLGFTPLHLACQMGHWHLVPILAEAMQRQHSRVAAWGPSPQYVSLNLADAYGRTPLDIALLRCFSNPLQPAPDGKTPTTAEQKKAVDILRECVRGSPREDSTVCGWEILRVLRFLEALPSRKDATDLGGEEDWL